MVPSSEAQVAYLGLFSVQIIFAAYPIIAKILLAKGYHPVAFAFLRELGATTLLLVAAACLMPRQQLLLRHGHLGHILASGVLMFGNIVGLVIALQLTSVTAVATIQVLRPVFTVLLSAWTGREAIDTQRLVGLLLCCAGGTLVALLHGAQPGSLDATSFVGANSDAGKPVSDSSRHTVGCLLALVHAGSFSGLPVQQGTLLQAGYSPLTINAYSHAVATMLALTLTVLSFTLLPGLATESPSGTRLWDGSCLFVAALLYSVLFVTVFNYVVMTWASKKLGPTSVMLFTALQGALAVTAAHLVLHETLLPVQALGGAVEVLGLVVFLFAGKKAEEQHHSHSPVETSVHGLGEQRPLLLGHKASAAANLSKEP